MLKSETFIIFISKCKIFLNGSKEKKMLIMRNVTICNLQKFGNVANGRHSVFFIIIKVFPLQRPILMIFQVFCPLLISYWERFCTLENPIRLKNFPFLYIFRTRFCQTFSKQTIIARDLNLFSSIEH